MIKVIGGQIEKYLFNKKTSLFQTFRYTTPSPKRFITKHTINNDTLSKINMLPHHRPINRKWSDQN